MSIIANKSLIQAVDQNNSANAVLSLTDGIQQVFQVWLETKKTERRLLRAIVPLFYFPGDIFAFTARIV
ncbi:hypothetical protein MH215_13195 [Paenibacillus sp. ACRSA]|uniref:hypothetical protein n=1 Tax=Paenibacillus sp. ACRSA TaxID=2918211 RepID=UPI001EF6EF0D|nr:hypothetical protein [Paenibacillus sp. ACRSA]MCG7377954.1 hypothetical protein [Paenibacillus sp. ACRSA]